MSILLMFFFFFFFKQKTAYEMRISDWSSDVCSSDLQPRLDDIDLGELDRRVLEIARKPGRASGHAAKQAEQHDGSKNSYCVCLAKHSEIGRASCRERVCQYV